MVALDACDCAIAERLASNGRMPSLADLLARGTSGAVEPPYAVWVSALWPSVWSACLPHRLDYYNWIELRPEDYVRSLTEIRAVRQRPFWEALSAAGLRVAVLDVPHAPPPAELDGVFLGEWGAHDRHHGLVSHPPELAAEIVARLGLHPNARIDTYAGRQFAPADWAHREGRLFDAEGLVRTFEEWLEGVALKERLAVELLEREAWDFAFVCMGESHDIGHVLWHQHDREHPRHDAELFERLGDPIERTYERLDRALARMVTAAGPEAAVVVYLSHGMGPHYDGGNVLDEALFRLERRLLDKVEPEGAGRARAAWRRLPLSLQRRMATPAAALLRSRWHDRLPAFEATSAAADALSSRRFYQVPNNDALGGIRFNRIGREGRGRVSPAEVEPLTDLLRRELLQLINVASGEPVVEAVVPLVERLERPAGGDSWPDLVVEWNRRRPIETVWSATVGMIHRPDRNLRTGDHRPRSLVVAASPADRTPRRVEGVRTVDLAPTLARALGRELADVDGRPVPGLLASLAVAGS